MNNALFITLLLFFSVQLLAQSDRVFNYSDTVFYEQSIHRIDITQYDGSGKIVKDSLGTHELVQLSDFIKSKPNFTFDIEHHTYHRGTAAYNLKLAEFRAMKLVNELIYNYGIDSTQISAIGYGESQPIIQTEYILQFINSNSTECEREAMHQVNRRTQLRIVQIIDKKKVD